jgi:hypothetical protein
VKALSILIFCVTTLVLGVDGQGAWFKTSKSKKQKQYTPSPAPSPAPAPSVDLSKFNGANLDKILGTLEQKVPIPRAELAQLRASFAARLSKAPAERKQFQAALAVCDALSKIMKERERAMLQPTAVTGWPQRAAQYRDMINQLMERESGRRCRRVVAGISASLNRLAAGTRHGSRSGGLEAAAPCSSGASLSL